MMDDKIILKNMMFYGFHGVHEYERQHGQRFYLDVEIGTELGPAGLTDDLANSIDYTKIYADIKTIMENSSMHLLEALAENIAKIILKHDLVQSVKVNVRKPLVPIPGQLDYVEVSIFRVKQL